MLSYEALKDLCDYQFKIESMANYMRQCTTSETSNCCNMWSLPNYIAWIMKLPSCRNITVGTFYIFFFFFLGVINFLFDFQPKNINSTLNLLASCSSYYREGKLSPRYTGNNVPRSCKQNNDIYNIIQYIVDVDYFPSKVKLFYSFNTATSK